LLLALVKSNLTYIGCYIADVRHELGTISGAEFLVFKSRPLRPWLFLIKLNWFLQTNHLRKLACLCNILKMFH
jgi:hypothetical protein